MSDVIDIRNRLKTVELTLATLMNMKSDIMDRVREISKHNSESAFSEKRKVSKCKQEFIDEKVRICRLIIFTLDGLKIDFEKELMHVRLDGETYADYGFHEDDTIELEVLIKDLYDEVDDD